MNTINPMQTEAWKALTAHFESAQDMDLKALFAADGTRFDKFSASFGHDILVDYSKNLITEQTLELLFSLARQTELESAIKAMFTGEAINQTENRAVLHTALRNRSNLPVMVDDQDVMPAVNAVLDKMQRFTERVISGEWQGYTGKAITDVVNVGIGGSDLGPYMVTEALTPYKNHLKMHFVSNVDGTHIQETLKTLNPETTLFLIASKTFTTQETMTNALTAREWFLSSAQDIKHVAKHFAALSTNADAVSEFGIDTENMFEFWDWVGGRYSLWSAIGLPISLALGFENFKGLLEGAFEMDTHFTTAPLEENMPVLLALLGVWYRNFFDAQSHVLLPYYHYLRGLPAYVQQLDMESNGKEVTQEGEHVDYPTGPIIWGSEGTNGQHSFHQLIHQGSGVIPADFMLPLNVPNQDDTHHAMLASNCFGQTQALMQGKTFEECYADLDGKGLDDAERKRLAAHKTMPGNKPSNTFLFDSLTPKTLGALVAMYEHKVFVQGVIWNLNSFDQWGVELGKVLGNQVLAGIQGEADKDNFDASTQQLIAKFRAANAPK